MKVLHPKNRISLGLGQFEHFLKNPSSGLGLLVFSFSCLNINSSSCLYLLCYNLIVFLHKLLFSRFIFQHIFCPNINVSIFSLYSFEKINGIIKVLKFLSHMVE